MVKVYITDSHSVVIYYRCAVSEILGQYQDKWEHQEDKWSKNLGFRGIYAQITFRSWKSLVLQ